MRIPSLFLFLSAVGVCKASPAAGGGQSAAQPILFAATWTKETTNGINTFKLNTADGSLTPYGITPLAFGDKGLNPTYVQGSKKTSTSGEHIIYVLNRGVEKGYVSAMTLQPDGKLEVLNTQEMKGASPAHIALSSNGKFLSVANYVGSLSLFPLNADGSIGKETFYLHFPVGSNVVKDTQATGHIHSTVWLPTSNRVIAADLGSDKLLQYEVGPAKKTVKSLETVRCNPGSGPRHLVVDQNGKFAYVTDELSNTVSVFAIDKESNLLSSKPLASVTTLPAGFTNTSSAADIHFSSNGQFLYVSNRGHDSIVSYKVNADGTLKALDWESSRGVTPRGFTIYGDWLIVANQGSDDMHVFKVDSKTGALTHTGKPYKVDGVVSLYVGE
ncbi:unnamed protein product [Hyaloperonospora brassicae]|uniref:6-phosphogluconolactonase n=1 Tax=Hyaloperonospora brassicae TaxID=162125 RepID=A0AAV0T5E3_HYABA|nr:unnamed protein product [Hyaloperonospora brassicae]